MPKIDITDLEKELRQGKVRPIYIIVGGEHYLALASLQKIKETICKGDELSTKVFTGQQAKTEDVFGALKNVSMFSPRPVVILRDADSISKGLLEALASYAENPVEDSTLVVVAEKLDGRSKFMQLSQKVGVIIECKPLYMDKIPAWLNMQFKLKGRQISQDAAAFLAELVGADLGQLSQAIEKVILFVGEKKMVELKDIETAVAETHQRTIFELTDAVGKRNLQKAISILHNIVENGEPLVLVLNMLARHFRILSKAKEIGGRGLQAGEVAKYLGVHPFFAKEYIGQARNFSGTELRSGFRILHRADRELKSSKITKERILERALIEIIQHP